MRKRTWKRSGYKPTRVWSDVSGSVSFSGITGSQSVTLISLESPTNLGSLTSDPPEDLTLLRIVGDLNVSMSGVAQTGFRLALLVQDRTWTASAVQSDDNDKRILWSQAFYTIGTTQTSVWYPSGVVASIVVATGDPVSIAYQNATHIDISPRVKMEAGKSLYMVAYETINGSTMTVNSQNLRVLYQRSGRR